MSKTFSQWYDFFMGPLEQGRFKTIRKSLLSQATGTVLEIGSGTGVNFPLYKNVVQVTAIEPSEFMLSQSQRKREQAKVPIHLIQAGAEKLPFADNMFDTIVATLVYCTIPDSDRAAAEMKRVCKPGGQVLMFEHVKMRQPVPAKLQELLTPAWRKICDGCCLDRDTVGLMKKHGFKIVEQKEDFKGLFVAMNLKNDK
ncbi:class I SAM-dependent methyltransferase [Bacillus sp. FJAT-27251]|uniref:class I SAM-dependent methyltransferase n=1 Tax=Bacillus sp. FJAT-27251 TaxID=1684142 RepID=UPI0006A7A3BB|nr:class I SAM-dependent methyltransferase [Bacillus sp. FJAT-27251]